MVLCGNDEIFIQKPDPYNLHIISNILNIPTYDMAMIGNTTGDMKMANAIDVFAIGVLTGVGTRQDLEKYSNIIMNSCDDLITS